MSRAVLFAGLASLALLACGPAHETAAGFVVDVQSASVTEVKSFVLRTPEGGEMLFSVGVLDLGGEAFPAGHLREHMALGQAVAVAFIVEDGVRYASRIVDAPWLQP